MSTKAEKICNSSRTSASRELPVMLNHCSSEALSSRPLSSGSLSSWTPVSEGQLLEKLLKERTTENAAAHPSNAKKKLWKLLRDLRAIEKAIKRGLEIAELMPAFDEWHRLSRNFLDHAKTRDD